MHIRVVLALFPALIIVHFERRGELCKDCFKLGNGCLGFFFGYKPTYDCKAIFFEMGFPFFCFVKTKTVGRVF